MWWLTQGEAVATPKAATIRKTSNDFRTLSIGQILTPHEVVRPSWPLCDTCGADDLIQRKLAH
jgi:hypothetical protein